MVEDFTAILGDVGVKVAILLRGHDCGAVQYFAPNQSKRVSKLIILNTPIIGPFFELIHFGKEQ